MARAAALLCLVLPHLASGFSRIPPSYEDRDVPLSELTKEAFEEVDGDGDGYLSPDELKRLMCEEGIACGDDAVADAMNVLDTDGAPQRTHCTVTTTSLSHTPSHPQATGRSRQQSGQQSTRTWMG